MLYKTLLLFQFTSKSLLCSQSLLHTSLPCKSLLHKSIPYLQKEPTGPTDSCPMFSIVTANLPPGTVSCKRSRTAHQAAAGRARR